MLTESNSNTHFYGIGISYEKADAVTRGKFNITQTAQDLLAKAAKSKNYASLLIISTCNRTELYGNVAHPYELISLLCKHTNGTVEEFQQYGYLLKNEEAEQHLFRVGTGLDSQILGDFEIIGQIKKGFKLAKKYQLADMRLERLVNAVFQASKRVKTETSLSEGATSVSFAAADYILKKVNDPHKKNILLFGVGKIGRNTCENLVKHTQNPNITLINRTRDKAESIAGKFNLLVKDLSELSNELQHTDILIVATGANHAVITEKNLPTDKKLLIFDLSIPKNVDENVAQMPGVDLVHLDQLSKITDDTLESRKLQVPVAEKIIDEVYADYKTWLESRKIAPTLKALKAKLADLKELEIKSNRSKIENFNVEQAEVLAERIIQKITGHFANHLKENGTASDQTLQLIHQVFKLEQLEA